jgi:DNA polymerase III alpha subunit
MGDSKKLSNHFMHFHRNIRFEYPKMNKCEAGYSLDEGRQLMIGLGAVKDIGNSEQYCQKFESLTDFINKVDLDKTKITQLINAGYFDDIEPDREALLGNIEIILAFSKNSKVGKKNFLFCMQTSNGFTLDYSKRRSYSKSGAELDAFGFNIKEGFMVKNSNIMGLLPDNHMVGIVSKIKRVKTKKSNADMARLEVSTNEGTHNLMMFPNVFEKCGPWLFEDQTYIFQYTINPPKDQYDETMVIQNIINCNEFYPKKLILLDRDGFSQERISKLPITSSGKIEVWYEGDYLSVYQSELVGYLNVLDDQTLDQIPPQLEVTIEVFDD